VIAATTIDYVSHASVPSTEANSVQVMKMSAALARRCAGLALYCRATDRPVETARAQYGVPEDFELVPIRSPRTRIAGRMLYSLRLVRQLHRRGGTGLLYGRDYHTLALAARTELGRRPTVLEVHQPPGSRLAARLIETVLRGSHFARLVVISRALADEYERRYGELVLDRITVAHDGADDPGNEALSGPPSRSSRLRLGYLGNLYPGKGLERIEELALALPDCDFHVIGGKVVDVERWRDRIRSPNVVFHGFLPHGEAQHRLRDCDVVLAPFQSSVLIGEGAADIGRWMSPLKIFEYMGVGRPIVASDLPVLREVLRDDHNALLADPDATGSWVEKIRRLEADRELRNALATQAADDLRRHYTWDRRAARILADLPAWALGAEPEPAKVW
jgi:glycosyltransferase involved in cell wall biosynthesis